MAMLFAMKLFVFLMLIVSAKAFSCPSDMIQVANFCIDKYEAPNKVGVRPFVARTALDAERWCKENGKELCSDVQWQRSCEGNTKRKYPYGNTYNKRGCNDQKVWRVPNWRLIARYNPTNPDSHPPSRDHVNQLNQSEPSGAFEKCRSEDGVYDLTGNVAEWVRNTKGSRSTGNAKIYPHVMKGCYWSKCYKGVLPNCQFKNPNHASAFRSYEAGFRCCLKL